MNKPSHAPRQDAWAAWRFRAFCLFFARRVLLFRGFQVQTVAVGWELYDRTGSAWLYLGLVGLGRVCKLPIVKMEG